MGQEVMRPKINEYRRDVGSNDLLKSNKAVGQHWAEQGYT